MEPLGTSTVLPSTEIFTSSVRTVVFAAEALTLRLNIIARVRTAANTRFLILFSSSFFFGFPQLGGAGGSLTGRGPGLAFSHCNAFH